MNIHSDWVVLDTNIWIFGLRNQSDRLACAELLRQMPRLYVKLPRQILLELQRNLSREEMSGIFRLLGHYSDHLDVQWDQADPQLVGKYQQMGCKLGDAAVAAHVEAMGVKALVTDNRDFLVELSGLPFRTVRAEDVLRKLGQHS